MTTDNQETPAVPVGCDALFDLPPIRRKRTNNKAAINRWKQEHRILTHFNRDMEEPWTALAPKLTMEDVADRCVLLEETGEMVFGATEQEACERIAANSGISIPC